MSTPELVVLVDESDRELGVMGKYEAHTGPGFLHRAFSVVLVDGDGRVLLQQRAETKHHFRGLWANSCCSHPRPGETAIDAGLRRVREELGVDPTAVGGLTVCGRYLYRAEDAESGLVEHELDWVLLGRFDGDPAPTAAEVQDWRWFDPADLAVALVDNPGAFAPWAAPVLDLALASHR